MGSCMAGMCPGSCGECCGMMCAWFGFDFMDHEPVPDVKTEGRSCTDVAWVLVFVAMWVASISILGTRSGNVRYLVRGTDYRGEMCGYGSNAGKPYAYYPKMTDVATSVGSVVQFQNDGVNRFVMCASSCNATRNPDNVAGGQLGIYISEPIGYFCTFSAPGNDTSLNTVATAKKEAGTAEYIGDIEKSVNVIAICVAVALVVAVMFMMCMRYCLRIITYSAIGLSVGFTCWAAYDFKLAYDACELAQQAGGCDEPLAFCIISGVGAALLVLICYNMWNSISIGITIIEMSTKAVGDMPYSLVTPIPMTMITWAFLAYWVQYALVLYSDAEVKTIQGDPFASSWYTQPVALKGQAITIMPTTPVPQTTPQGFNGTITPTVLPTGPVSGYKMLAFNYAVSENSMWFHLFFGLWNVQFLNYFTFTMLAGAFADWYFSEWDADECSKLREEEADQDHRLSNTPILSSTYRVCRFHTGTVLVASLIVAIIDFIRCVVYYIKRNLHESLTYVSACIDCVLWCVRCIMDIVSKNSLIYCSIWGTPFCSSATNSFFLLLGNASVAFAVNGITWIIMFLGKFIVAAMSTLICHYILDYSAKNPEATLIEGDGKLSSEKFVLLIVFAVSYVMACMFLSVYEVAIDTIFMGYMVCPERADDSLRQVCEENKLDEDDPTIQEMKLAHGQGDSDMHDLKPVPISGNTGNNAEDIEHQGVRA